jgi:hypothetical protein
MKFFYCLCAVALLGTLAIPAKAFRLQVLDPPTFPGDVSVTALTITGPFSATFGQVTMTGLSSNCPEAQGPWDDGTFCFDGFNGTGQAITSLTFTVPNNTALGGQSIGCATDEFTSPTVCTPPSPSDDDYTAFFSGGAGIPKGGFFIIAETGADPSALADNTVTPGFVPEPSSILMLSSAAAMFGLLLFSRRRSAHDSLL